MTNETRLTCVQVSEVERQSTCLKPGIRFSRGIGPLKIDANDLKYTHFQGLGPCEPGESLQNRLNTSIKRSSIQAQTGKLYGVQNTRHFLRSIKLKPTRSDASGCPSKVSPHNDQRRNRRGITGALFTELRIKFYSKTRISV